MDILEASKLNFKTPHAPMPKGGVIYRHVDYKEDPKNPQPALRISNIHGGIPWTSNVVDIDGNQYNIGFWLHKPLGKDQMASQAKNIDGLQRLNFVKGELRVLPTERKLYEYLEHCSYNRDNADAVPGQRIFYRYDPEKQIREKNKLNTLRATAIRMFDAADQTAIRAYAQSVNIDDTKPYEIIEALVFDIANEKPELFVKNFTTNDTMVLSVIKDAQRYSILTFNTVDGRRSWLHNFNGQPEFLLEVPKNVNDIYAPMISYLVADNGGTTIKHLQSLIDQAKIQNDAVAPLGQSFDEIVQEALQMERDGKTLHHASKHAKALKKYREGLPKA